MLNESKRDFKAHRSKFQIGIEVEDIGSENEGKRKIAS